MAENCDDDLITTSDEESNVWTQSDRDLSALGLKGLDEDQLAFVTAPRNLLASVVAGPGSGKSHSLLFRVHHLMMEEGGLHPENFILISFTNKSAGELRDRWTKMMLSGNPSRNVRAVTPWISTIHRLGYHVLAERFFTASTVLSERRANTVMTRWLKETFPKPDEGEALDQSPVLEAYEDLISSAEFPFLLIPTFNLDGSLSNLEPTDFQNPAHWAFLQKWWPVTGTYLNSLTEHHEPDQLTVGLAENIREFYWSSSTIGRNFTNMLLDYTRTKRGSQSFDYNDMLLLPALYFIQYPELTYNLRQQYREILVDEAQDLSPADLAFLRAVFDTEFNPCPTAVPETNFTFIGDDKQSLFQFRGAFPKGLEYIDKIMHPRPLSVFKLTRNYRSTGSIVTMANRFSEIFDRRFKWDSVAIQETERNKIAYNSFKTVYDENAWLMQSIRQAMKEDPAPNSIAILVRTNSSIANIEAALVASRIPYTVKADAYSLSRSVGFNFYHSVLSLWFNPYDQLSFNYLMSNMRGIGKLGQMTIADELKVFFKENPDAKIDQFIEARRKDKRALMKSAVRGYDLFIKLAEYGSAAGTVDRQLAEVQRPDPTASADEFFDALNYLRDITDDVVTSMKDSSLTRVRELIPHLREFIQNDPEAQGGTPAEQARAIYATFALAVSANEIDPEPDDTEKLKVTLSTIHSFKGREADYTYYAHLNRSTQISKADEDAEACAFFVAITRPRKKLFLTASSMVLNYARQLVPSVPNPLLRRYLDGAKRS